MKQILSISLSPNVESDDVSAAASMLVQPWNWRKKGFVREAEQWFLEKFPEYTVRSFNSGRSALFEICKAFKLQRGDEVLVQAFTCVAVPNSILWAGATPIYVDIDTSLNLDLKDAERKITAKTKAILVQHTFGLTADMRAVLSFARKHNILVIEDCAHALGGSVNSKLLGSFGDASFFSFGRDKVLSSVFGGMGLIQHKHTDAVKRLTASHASVPEPKMYWILQQLLHPILFSIILPIYRSGIGKVLLVLFQKLTLLSFPVYPEEKKGQRPADFPAQFPNALAKLLLVQLSKLEIYNDRRKKAAQVYIDAFKSNKDITLLTYPAGSNYLRFPVLVKNPEIVLRNAKKEGIMLGNWYHNVIDPVGTDFSKIAFDESKTPGATHISGQIINLPTNIPESCVRRVIHFLQNTSL